MHTADNDLWPSIDELEAQERDLVLERADLASLHDLGRLMSQAAEERELPVVIQIRAGARLVYVAALPGSGIERSVAAPARHASPSISNRAHAREVAPRT